MSQSHIICVIDFENLHIPCERATNGSPRDALINIPSIMSAVSTAVGMPHVVRAYAPWHAYRAYQRALDGAGVERIDVTTKSDATIHRNAADLRIAIDVMDYIHDHPGCTVVIVGGDGGYTFLAMTCRRHGCQVHILAYPNTLAETLERAATKTIPWPQDTAVGSPMNHAPAATPVSAMVRQPAVKPTVVQAVAQVPVAPLSPVAAADQTTLDAATRRRLIEESIIRNTQIAKRVTQAKADAQAVAQAKERARAMARPSLADIAKAVQELRQHGPGPYPMRSVIDTMRRQGTFTDGCYGDAPVSRVFRAVAGVVITMDGTRTMLDLAA